MFVVRKLDGELAFVFRFRSLIRIVRFAKSEPRIFARRGMYVADRANRRPRAGECLPPEELLPVAAYTRIVIGKIRGVGKIPVRRPGGRQLVAGVARETLVFFRRVEKGGILRSRSDRSLLRDCRFRALS